MLCTVLLLLSALCYRAETACSPAEEGQPTTLTCDVTATNRDTTTCQSQLTWQAVGYTRDVLTCSKDRCGSGQFSGIFSGTSSSPPPATTTIITSVLTIANVSRIDPFDMETRWSCTSCDSTTRAVPACDKLEIYVRPSSPVCTVTEMPTPGAVTETVRLSCSTDRVYPRAKCIFLRSQEGGKFVEITQEPEYKHSETGSEPQVYFRSDCAVSVPVQQLGEGTHSFRMEIYSDVTNGENLAAEGVEFDDDVTLAFPQATHACSDVAVDGYFRGTSTRCTCTLTSDGNPRGTARWYKGGTIVAGSGSDGALTVEYDKDNAEQVYTCEGQSALGHKIGSTLRAKFAFMDTNSVDVTSSPSTVDVCGTDDQAQVTCKVSMEHVSPEPTFSFSLDGLTFQPSQRRSVSGAIGSYYQSQYSLVRDRGGEYQVSCRVTNSVLDTRQVNATGVIFRKPPPSPPQVRVNRQIYQGHSASNIVTLAEGYKTDLTCRVDGGYPAVHSTQLRCGQLLGPGDRNFANLTLTAAQMTRTLNGTVCTCTGQHASGCYGNNQTSFTLNFLYLRDKSGDSDSLRTAAIATGVVAVVIIAALVVVIVFLLRKVQSQAKKPVPQSKPPTAQSIMHGGSGNSYSVPLELPPIKTTATTATTTTAAGAPAKLYSRPSQYDPAPHYVSLTDEPYLSVSHQDEDQDPSNVYSNMKSGAPNPPTTTTTAAATTANTANAHTSGVYNNIGRHVAGIPGTGVSTATQSAATTNGTTSTSESDYSNVFVQKPTENNLRENPAGEVYENFGVN